MDARSNGVAGRRGGVLGRRALAIGAAALTGALTRRAVAAPARAPRREMLSVGFGTSQMKEQPIPALTTNAVAVELESLTQAIRIGIANDTPQPYALGGVCCCEADPGDPWKARAGAQWAPIGFGGPAARGPTPVSVPGNRPAATGADNVPAILWSDWVPYRTAGPGRPILLIRMLVPPQTLPLALVPWPDDSARFEPSIPPRLRAARHLAGDFVTDPGRPAPPGARTLFTPLFVVQYRSATAGVPIVIGGDSQISHWFTFAQLAAMRLSTPALPITVWDTGWGGVSSRTFWPILETAIEAAQPSVTVIQGWTANDGGKLEIWERYLEEVRRSVEHTRRLGGVPIVFTGMPRRLSGSPAQAANWERFNAALGRRLPGALIFDVDPVAEDPAHPGDWRPQLSKDGFHPNFAGDLALADAFAPMLRSLL